LKGAPPGTTKNRTQYGMHATQKFSGRPNWGCINLKARRVPNIDAPAIVVFFCGHRIVFAEELCRGHYNRVAIGGRGAAKFEGITFEIRIKYSDIECDSDDEGSWNVSLRDACIFAERSQGVGLRWLLCCGSNHGKPDSMSDWQQRRFLLVCGIPMGLFRVCRQG